MIRTNERGKIRGGLSENILLKWRHVNIYELIMERNLNYGISEKSIFTLCCHSYRIR